MDVLSTTITFDKFTQLIGTNQFYIANEHTTRIQTTLQHTTRATQSVLAHVQGLTKLLITQPGLHVTYICTRQGLYIVYRHIARVYVDIAYKQPTKALQVVLVIVRHFDPHNMCK